MADTRTFKRIRVMISGTMQTVFQFFTATISPATGVTGGVVSDGNPVTGTTPPATATAQGGTGPFVYTWTVTSTSGHTWTVLNQGAATTSFSATPLSPNTPATAKIFCTITDDDSNEAVTPTIDGLINCFYLP